VGELLANFVLFFGGFVLIKFYPLVCGSISRNGEGLHRSQGAGMVLNDIIVSLL
jgi:hypothetical protein